MLHLVFVYQNQKYISVLTINFKRLLHNLHCVFFKTTTYTCTENPVPHNFNWFKQQNSLHIKLKYSLLLHNPYLIAKMATCMYGNLLLTVTGLQLLVVSFPNNTRHYVKRHLEHFREHWTNSLS